MNIEVKNKQDNKNDLKAKIMENSEKENNIKQEKTEKTKTNKNNIIERVVKENATIAHKEESEEELYYTPPKVIKRKSKKTMILIPMIVILLILILAIFSIININSKKILSGIKVDNISLKGLTKDQAKMFLQKKAEETEYIILDVDGKEYAIEKGNIQFAFDIDKAVEEAYNEGRNSNFFVNNFNIINNIINGKNIKSESSFDLENLNDEISAINSQLPNGLIEDSYRIEETNLIISKGEKGISVDIKDLQTKIKNNIHINSQGKIYVITEEKEPKDIDIVKIKEDINQGEFKELFDLDIEIAKEILAEDKNEYIIPLIIKNKDLLNNMNRKENFPQLLGKCKTNYSEANVSRATNLKVASRAINGKIIMPGEIFSYNETLGKRTYAKGYRYGPGFAGGNSVPMLGGGICQISSTLYDATIYANLEIVERYNHGHRATYLDPSKDATVNYGSYDFKFKNTRKNPIMIVASSKNGVATVEIYGKREEKEYEIEIVSIVKSTTPHQTKYKIDNNKQPGYRYITQYGLTGCTSVAYKIYKLNGKEVSRELLSEDIYYPMTEYITIGPTNSQSPIPTTTPIESPTPTTTPTESPTPTTTPTESPTPTITPTESPTPTTTPTESPTPTTTPTESPTPTTTPTESPKPTTTPTESPKPTTTPTENTTTP